MRYFVVWTESECEWESLAKAEYVAEVMRHMFGDFCGPITVETR